MNSCLVPAFDIREEERAAEEKLKQRRIFTFSRRFWYILCKAILLQAPRKEQALVAMNYFEICFLQGKFFTCKWLFT
jgi:hypothetical protein